MTKTTTTTKKKKKKKKKKKIPIPILKTLLRVEKNDERFQNGRERGDTDEEDIVAKAENKEEENRH